MPRRSFVGLMLVALMGGCMSHARPGAAGASRPVANPDYRAGAVRYQVTDVKRAIAFYTGHLGFHLVQNPSPAFASVANGPLTLWLSGPGSSGARPMLDGRTQEPGGWNRIALEVTDLDAVMAVLREQGVKFRNAVEVGAGGSQVQIEDPDGNPVELFQPAPAKR